VEHHKADVRQVAGRVASADDTARFLRELRQLRDGAGLGHAELAARAHYPYDSIKAAEVGPALPDLPVLSAFVRGCGGTTEEWEERWRSLSRTPSLPVSEARNAGGSPAAAAGARIGSVAQVADNPDPSLIIAALNRVAEGMASGNDEAPPSSDDAASWADFPAGALDELPAGVPAGFEVDVPADFQVDVPAGFEVDVPAGFASGVPDGYQPEVPVSFEPDVPAGYRPDFPADFEPGVPAGSAPDVPAGSLPGARAASAARPFMMDEPGPDGMPKGWDPIRVSSAWPAIPASLLDLPPVAEGGTETPPWEAAPWAEDPSDTAHASAVVTRSPRGPGPSTTWVVAVAVVLLCVLAVVLAIFA
jgi:hypothetical protein